MSFSKITDNLIAVPYSVIGCYAIYQHVTLFYYRYSVRSLHAGFLLIVEFWAILKLLEMGLPDDCCQKALLNSVTLGLQSSTVCLLLLSMLRSLYAGHWDTRIPLCQPSGGAIYTAPSRTYGSTEEADHRWVITEDGFGVDGDYSIVGPWCKFSTCSCCDISLRPSVVYSSTHLSSTFLCPFAPIILIGYQCASEGTSNLVPVSSMLMMTLLTPVLWFTFFCQASISWYKNIGPTILALVIIIVSLLLIRLIYESFAPWTDISKSFIMNLGMELFGEVLPIGITLGFCRVPKSSRPRRLPWSKLEESQNSTTITGMPCPTPTDRHLIHHNVFDDPFRYDSSIGSVGPLTTRPLPTIQANTGHSYGGGTFYSLPMSMVITGSTSPSTVASILHGAHGIKH